MSDDIKSMIKSRRDERYYGSTFEKRDSRTDLIRQDAAYVRSGSNKSLPKIANKGPFSEEEYIEMVPEAGKDLSLNRGREINTAIRERDLEDGDFSEDTEGDLQSPKGERGKTENRNVGMPREQRSRDKIYYGANSYVADLQDGKGIDPINQLEPGEIGYSALLDAGYNDEDVIRFKEMLDKLSDDSMRRLDAARANAKRISRATGPKMVDGRWYD